MESSRETGPFDELIFKAHEGVLTEWEQSQLDQYLRDPDNRQYYAALIKAGVLLQTESVLDPFARRGSLSWRQKIGLAAIAAVLLLAVMLYIQADHQDRIPKQVETPTVFDPGFNQQTAVIRERIIKLNRTAPVSEKGLSYKKLKDRIDNLKKKPIFRKENDHVEKSVFSRDNGIVVAKCETEHPRHHQRGRI
ncbi:MAG: hypothetical protein JSU70_05190 [Phycisphaerales bacterium]|nr:MAG: hypothetical protein JSU70_05190 [Phycisphaerales bacterium]